MSNDKKIKIIIIEGHELIRLGLRFLITNEKNLILLNDNDSIDNIIELALHCKPDIILLDLKLISINNFKDLMYRLKLAHCPLKIIILTDNNDEQMHFNLLHSGVSGIFHKHHNPDLLLKSIYVVDSGEMWFDRSLMKLFCPTQINDTLSKQEDYHDYHCDKFSNKLTNKECYIACLASSGLSAKKIGTRLSITEKTVRNYLTLVYHKLSVTNQIELCLKAHQLNFCALNGLLCNRDKCPKKE